MQKTLQNNQQNVRKSARVPTRAMMTPSVVLLLLWMIIPLAMTLYFSTLRYTLLNPERQSFVGFSNYHYFFEDPSLWVAINNTVLLVIGVLFVSIVMGIIISLLFLHHFPGRRIAQLMVIAPFFIMPTVAALLWKNLLMHPVNGLFSWVFKVFGMTPVDWFAQFPLFSVGMIVAWQWVPFAALILMTAIQSLDDEQLEAARIDGAKSFSMFRFIILPHLYRAISVVAMIEAIFLLSVFAEILVTTNGGPGSATTTLPYLIYKTALLDFNIGLASTGGIFAVILANIVGFFLIKTVSKNLTT